MLAAVHAIGPASPADDNPSPARRHVLIHLTPDAAGIPDDARTHAPCRWMRFIGCTPEQAMRRIVERLHEAPWNLRLDANGQGEVQLHPGGLVHCPLAIVVEGLTLAEAARALQTLRREARQ